MPQKNQNQNNPQDQDKYFGIIETGASGVKSMLAHKSNELWALRPQFIKNEQRDAYINRAATHIIHNEQIRPMLSSRSGLFKVYQELIKAFELGLNLGGTRPHAYITAFGGDVSLIPTADGYIYALTAGDDAPFKDVIGRAVYDKDEIKIDEARGIVEHEPYLKGDRGKFCGVYVLFIDHDDRQIVKWVQAKRVFEIRDTKSAAHRAFANGKRNSSTWNDDFEPMAIKTAIKTAAGPYITRLEGMAAMVDLEGGNAPEAQPVKVSERALSRLDKQSENIKPTESETDIPYPDPDPAEANKKENQELF